MQKPVDRLAPTCYNPYYIFEQWGGNSWFTPEPKSVQNTQTKEEKKK